MLIIPAVRQDDRVDDDILRTEQGSGLHGTDLQLHIEVIRRLVARVEILGHGRMCLMDLDAVIVRDGPQTLVIRLVFLIAHQETRILFQIEESEIQCLKTGFGH